MDRRVAGVMLLFVALVAALVVPNIVGKRVSGAAVAEVIAGPPAVGSCVTAITDPVVTRAGGRDQATVARTLPVATIAPCTGKVLGEIISVTPTNSPQVSTLQEFDQTHPSCRTQVEPYLGTTATTDVLGVQWSKSIYVNAVSVGPDAHDRAAGRTWSACVLAAVGQTYQAPPVLKASWKADALPDVFGLCWADTIVQHGVPTTCTTPHTTQQLAFGFVPGPSDSATSIVSAPSSASVQEGCLQVAAAIMGVKDPTYGGALTVRVVSDPNGAPYVQCAASLKGSKSLVGSLIGLAGNPLPVA